ncbi:PCMD domain-containing protein [Pedobacter miscanthi]|uniref:PCMD domain-containing protein n=1 Tax=Pedobacter miscanthi TaxID=2259170 RepID=UPI00292D46A2|nr:PCMD domain-containing protein [Pedobacter miscanthi]
MKRLLLVSCLLLLLGSCIKDAPKNPEADITSFSIDPKQLTGDTFIDQANGKILLYLTKEAYEQGVVPTITVSKNAKIYPSSGEKINFNTTGQITYTVTAERPENKKNYVIQVINVGDWSFEFEKWGQNDNDKWEYPIEDDLSTVWSSGNEGVAISGVAKDPLAYPTRSTTDGYMGTRAAEMVTIKGTALSAFVGIYLYAGSLYIGNFNPSVVLTQPLAATEFGEPYVGLPGRFTGYYKYVPGANYQDENQNIIPGRTDECTIYAVLFEGTQRLNGTNILTSDRVVAKAVLNDGSMKSAFTKFDIPFVYRQGWTAQAGTKMMMAIVTSSSKEGDHYRGALGSRLVVDHLAVIPK